MNRPRVFLSYPNQDRKLAAEVGRELSRLGVSSYDPDTELKAGDDWRKAIMKGIRESDAVVVFVTEPRLAASSWIGYEVGSASALGKDVFVMKPAAFSMSDLPSDLTASYVLDFDVSSPSDTARALASRLRVAA